MHGAQKSYIQNPGPQNRESRSQEGEERTAGAKRLSRNSGVPDVFIIFMRVRCFPVELRRARTINGVDSEHWNFKYMVLYCAYKP
jgi:hypothetical protein